jgi:hypothetical protein
MRIVAKLSQKMPWLGRYVRERMHWSPMRFERFMRSSSDFLLFIGFGVMDVLSAAMVEGQIGHPMRHPFLLSISHSKMWKTYN